MRELVLQWILLIFKNYEVIINNDSEEKIAWNILTGHLTTPGAHISAKMGYETLMPGHRTSVIFHSWDIRPTWPLIIKAWTYNHPIIENVLRIGNAEELKPFVVTGEIPRVVFNIKLDASRKKLSFVPNAKS